MRKALILLLLISFSYASLLWQYSTDGPISLKPVIYQGTVVVASDDGKIYAIDPNSGLKRWQTNVGKKPTDIIVFDNGVVVSTTFGKVVKISNTGSILWTRTINSSYIYGMSANQKEIFLTTNNGLYLMDKINVTKLLVNFSDSVVGLPTAGPDFVIYGKGNELRRVKENGDTLWKMKLDQGTFWTSRPVIENGVVYIGALDNQMHAYIANNGLEIWQMKTRNWIMSTPVLSNGIVYFGSNDGNVYALDSGSGNVKWETETYLAIQTRLESGIMGGEEVVFVGSSDKSIYAISKDKGQILWKGVVGGVVGDPLFYQNMIIFGSGDGQISAYSTERACSITSPREADLVGLKELVIGGEYVSEASNAKVMLNINEGGWIDTNTSQDDWIYYLDPKIKLYAGLNTLSCKVVDSNGEEQGPTYTTIAINHDPTIALNNFVITVSPDVVEGVPFIIFVNDGEDGTPVNRFNLTVDGNSYLGDKNVTVTVTNAGEHKITIKKIGFNDGIVNVHVNSSGVSPLILCVSALGIIVILFFVWNTVLKQKFAAKK
ncbi:MAG: PQQ-binding-like beta-propeller repeat protein [Candidatus Micrarchaeota archaeon]